MHNIIEKLASELIAAASCRREFNVSIGNPRMLLIASMFFINPYNYITLCLSMNDIATMSLEFVKLTI